jgi:hypothetical protein
MRGRLTESLLLFSMLVLLPGIARAQAATSTGKITGKVTDVESGQAIPFANVLILGTSWGAMTNDQGVYTITPVPVGTYSLKAMIIGFDDVTVADVKVDQRNDHRDCRSRRSWHDGPRGDHRGPPAHQAQADPDDP